MNHYSKFFRSRQVHHLQEEDDSQNGSDDSGDRGDESSLFVYAVESNSLATYSNLKRRPSPPLRKTRTVLVSFSKHKPKPRGEVVLTTKYKDQVENVKFFVVDTEVEPVLSGNSLSLVCLQEFIN